MKFTMIQVLAIQKIYESIKDQVLPLKTTYKLTKLYKAVDEEVVFFYNELKKILEEFGDREEDGSLKYLSNGNVSIKAGCQIEAQRRVDELNRLEVELPDVKFSIEEMEAVKLTVEQFNNFLSFIEE